MNNPRKPQSRRDQIIEAAFSLSRRNISWSMRDLAWEVGVSKPALYRHFSNRAELEEVMETRVFAFILSAIRNAGTTNEDIRTVVVSALRSNPEYYMYITKNLLLVKSFFWRALDYIKEQSPYVSDFLASLKDIPTETATKRMLEILKSSVTILISSYSSQGMREYLDEILRKNREGFPELVCPQEARLDELETISITTERSSDSQLLEAIARAVESQGIENITVEKIAEETGLAKSSLYSHFESKEAMLSELIRHESETISKLLTAYIQQGETTEEQIYLALLAQVRYILDNPKIVPVSNWIRYEMITQHQKSIPVEQGVPVINEYFKGTRIETRCADSNLGVFAIFKWILILSGSATIRIYEEGYKEKDILNYIRIMYKLILLGDKELV